MVSILNVGVSLLSEVKKSSTSSLRNLVASSCELPLAARIFRPRHTFHSHVRRFVLYHLPFTSPLPAIYASLNLIPHLDSDPNQEHLNISDADPDPYLE